MAVSAATLACAITRSIASRLVNADAVEASSLPKAMQSACFAASRDEGGPSFAYPPPFDR